jgi:hypothetical protein
MLYVQNAARERDDSQIAVLINRFEYKKHKNYGLSAAKCHLTPDFIPLKYYIC